MLSWNINGSVLVHCDEWFSVCNDEFTNEKMSCPKAKSFVVNKVVREKIMNDDLVQLKYSCSNTIMVIVSLSSFVNTT